MSTVYLRVNNPVASMERLEFPFTPQIDYSGDVKYDTYSTTHTNYQLYGYTRTENPIISLQCKFSAHTKEHFAMSEYAIRFLRTYTKMNYGRKDPMRGIPPRILRFYALGNPLFHNVPVVINKYSMTFPEDVDYVKGIISPDDKVKDTAKVREIDKPTNAGNGLPLVQREDGTQVVNVSGTRDRSIYLPIFFQITIGLLVQQNTYQAVTEFNLEDFATGKLGNKGYI